MIGLELTPWRTTDSRDDETDERPGSSAWMREFDFLK